MADSTDPAPLRTGVTITAPLPRDGEEFQVNLSDIGKLYSAEGPFVSVYVDATSAVENAAYHYDTAWSNVERELAEAGVDAATLDAVSAARGDHAEGNTRVVIASAGRVQLATSLPEHPVRPIIKVGPLPHVTPLVDAVTRIRPHVVALIDRQGADIFAFAGSEGSAAPEEFALVEGDAPDIRKVHGAGGWHMRHMQARAEEGWKHNAKEIVAALEQVARDISAVLIVAAGDSREIEIVHGELGADWRDRFVRVAGGRSEDGSAEHIWAEVARVIEEQRTKDAIALLDQFAGNRGRGEYAADGMAQVVTALRRSQVDTLLVAEDYTGEGDQLWFGPDPSQLGTSREELAAMGIEDPQQGEALDVLVRTTIATGALYMRVPSGTEQSPNAVGATLRFTLES